MAAFDEELLRKRYGFRDPKKGNLKGQTYSKLMSKIIAENQNKISEKILTRDQKRFQVNAKTLEKASGKTVIVPDIKDVLTKQTSILKGAEKGTLLTRTLRDSLAKDIKDVLLENNMTTKTGTVNKKLVGLVKTKMKQTFQDYTKRNPAFGMPSNIHRIAVTETRTIVNTVRHQYVQRMNQNLPDGFATKKKWRHNDSLSMESRRGHLQAARRAPINLNAQFELSEYKKTSKGQRPTGKVYFAEYPHDQKLPASELINCACELEYVFVKQRK
ncbi:hypothetical protein EHQ53_14060 [Leptospira langatensis]|uniref:Phage head morphogenesis protein n=1 Tax=Leptospira langatensis TaxID=2484983 RepID=A0ABY2M981_9LEPT|nr:hypothetical protein [Leptospira langatensis]TGL39642.1 hypothetical protein EHQ53_14060 [Leptospira langatensis]